MRAEEVPAQSMTSPHVSAQRQFKSLWTLGGLTPRQLGRITRSSFVTRCEFAVEHCNQSLTISRWLDIVPAHNIGRGHSLTV